MADSKTPISQELLPTTREEPSGVQPRKSRLAVMPLAVLLPALGDVQDLHRLGAHFERRLEALQNRAAMPSEDGEPERNAAEEAMLNQVLQWLSVEGEES